MTDDWATVSKSAAVTAPYTCEQRRSSGKAQHSRAQNNPSSQKSAGVEEGAGFTRARGVRQTGLQDASRRRHELIATSPNGQRIAPYIFLGHRVLQALQQKLMSCISSLFVLFFCAVYKRVLELVPGAVALGKQEG